MAFIITSKAPRCFSCLRRSLDAEMPALFRPIQVQVRGKKRLPRCTTITIRLLQDVQAYGREGTILAIAPARMRNHLYPRSQAAYMTVAEVRQAVANEMVMERDVSFGSGKQVPVKKEKQISYDMKMITPQRARELVDKIVPGTLEFERKPITQESNTSKELQSFIFGSVSSLDILTDITSKLATKAREVGFEDAAKVVMSLQDIQIITSGLNRAVVEAEKIKALGEFEITINLKTAEPLHRKVKVVPLKIGS